MDSDPEIQYKKQLEYEAYIESQKSAHVDIAKYVNNPNDSIKVLAEVLFSKSEDKLKDNLTGILMDEGTEVADVFCMLLELFLYGYGILVEEKYTIFDLVDSTDDLIFSIRSYLKSCGFTIKVDEVFDEDLNINLYRDRDDYYCQITEKPPDFLNFLADPWNILDYRLILNRKFNFDIRTPISTFRAFFINKQKSIFIVSFDFAK